MNRQVQDWHTVSGIHPGQGAAGLSHENRGVRVVLLHSRVGAVQERARQTL